MAKKKGQKEPQGPATIHNRKASFDYTIEDTYEAGIALVGSEVKSIFLGRANLTDGYCRVLNSELWLLNFDIEQYSHSAHYLPERRRDRKLLLHRREIDVLQRKTQEKGLALIPLRMYFNDKGRVKVLIGLGRGKKDYDKRQAIADKETRREREEIVRGKQRGE
ncbi:MAG: SsrA-binding protein SmpB [Armatimonadetes bacterium]|nr:SsrA-binding protein SmpB [Armatimonadota bacterium]